MHSTLHTRRDHGARPRPPPAADLRALVAAEPLAQLGSVQLLLHAGGHGGRLVLGRLGHSRTRGFLQRSSAAHLGATAIRARVVTQMASYATCTAL